MCGLTGFLSVSNTLPHDEWKPLLKKMASLIHHRGPDDNGVWCDSDAGIGLAHTRLSILDLSPAGHQPMASASGRYVMVFNGEIYNHLEIRAYLEKELETENTAIKWRGHSDTETLLAGFDLWDIEKTIKKTVGMFAIAVWDKQYQTLTLARDRLGEKPLYFGWQGDTFLFGSELKALKAHPDFLGEIDRNAVALQMRHNYIPAPYSIYNGIKKLIPGTLLTISLTNRDVEAVHYWDPRKAIENNVANPFSGTPDEAVDALDSLLRRTVMQQMISDVPLGAFLSGGIDSSTIVSLMQAQSSRPVRTFTIGFNEKDYNEAEHAKAVAKHLGTDHTELYVSSQQAMDVIPLLPNMYCEPFSDSSQIPTFLVSKLARQHVTVSLSGDGGDELFGGYNRYFKAVNLQSKIAKIPLPLRYLLAPMLKALPDQTWKTIVSPLSPLLKNKTTEISNKIQLAADLFEHGSHSDIDLYLYLLSHWKKPSELVLNSQNLRTIFSDVTLQPKANSFFQQMMGLDMLTYLPDDILTKVDRAAMSVSLETRVPLLDHRLVEFAWSIPLHYKVRNGDGKWPLRQVLYKYVPKELMERPKMGFAVPIAEWLRGSLRDWAEDLLNEQNLKQEGFFDSNLIRQKWTEHLAGTYDWEHLLWDVLMFQAWMKNQ